MNFLNDWAPQALFLSGEGALFIDNYFALSNPKEYSYLSYTSKASDLAFIVDEKLFDPLHYLQQRLLVYVIKIVIEASLKDDYLNWGYPPNPSFSFFFTSQYRVSFVL